MTSDSSKSGKPEEMLRRILRVAELLAHSLNADVQMQSETGEDDNLNSNDDPPGTQKHRNPNWV
jgi:hypothetical protein